jgi:hypothetical protein
MEIPQARDLGAMVNGLKRDENGNVDPAELLKMQMAMQAEAQLWSTLQNVSKMRHDASMNAIQNVRNAVR